jgi:hypothetical protein
MLCLCWNQFRLSRLFICHHRIFFLRIMDHDYDHDVELLMREIENPSSWRAREYYESTFPLIWPERRRNEQREYSWPHPDAHVWLPLRTMERRLCRDLISFLYVDLIGVVGTYLGCEARLVPREQEYRTILMESIVTGDGHRFIKGKWVVTDDWMARPPTYGSLCFPTWWYDPAYQCCRSCKGTFEVDRARVERTILSDQINLIGNYVPSRPRCLSCTTLAHKKEDAFIASLTIVRSPENGGPHCK